ncbi:DUF378 domain-containing protein [Candidatus Micrarchaeota archaeon]|nr:DUF378 domain-containing protein [Candidatus Micrarchaeota archaeon]
MNKMVDLIANILVIVGGLNWGLVGLLNLNLVTLIFGSVEILVTVVYVLVGLSAVVVAAGKFMK